MKPDTYFRHAGRPPCTASIARVCRNCGYYAKVRRRTIDQGWHVAEWGECRKADLTETGLMTSENGTCEEFTLDPRRWPNQTPCTANATDASGSVLPLTSSSSATDAGQDQHSGDTPEPLTHGSIVSAGSSSSPQRRRGRPNTCTANATDASGSVLKPAGSGEPTRETSKTTEESCMSLTSSEITSQCADGSPKRRGRPRKSP